MKKMLLFGLLVLVLFISCSKKDAPNLNSSNSDNVSLPDVTPVADAPRQDSAPSTTYTQPGDTTSNSGTTTTQPNDVNQNDGTEVVDNNSEYEDLDEDFPDTGDVPPMEEHHGRGHSEYSDDHTHCIIKNKKMKCKNKLFDHFIDSDEMKTYQIRDFSRKHVSLTHVCYSKNRKLWCVELDVE